MKKIIFRIVFIVALLVFVGAASYIAYTYIGYKKDADTYQEAVSEYVKEPEKAVSDQAAPTQPAEEEETFLDRYPDSIEVDFESLQELNPDIIGWIYCPDTVINYPILKADDNDYYLHRNYKKESSAAGSIFVECANRDGFVDSNTIIYGHHMKDGSMFASLSKWQNAEYYEEHPYMYLYTPEETYMIELFSAYTTAAGSDSYIAVLSPCEEMDSYLGRVKSKSAFTSEVSLPGDERYVMLSTCAYVFENARSVLHGKLVPIH